MLQSCESQAVYHYTMHISRPCKRVQKQTFLLEDLQTYVNKDKQFGLFSEMPGLVPGQISGCVQGVVHNSCLKG